MAKISKIGPEYRSAFNSICVLYQNGYIPNDILTVSPDGKKIVYKDTTFVYQPNKREDDDQEIKMETAGASWFKTLRDQSSVDSSSSDWLSLISDVAEYYHSENSFLEFKQKADGLKNIKQAEHSEKINKFIKTFYPHLSGYQVELVKGKDAFVDIYALNFIMNINNGVGEAQKVLGKLYFKYYNRHFSVLSKEESIDIEQQINNIIESSDFENVENKSNTLTNHSIIGDVLTQLDQVIMKSKLDDSPNSLFTKSFIQLSDKDKKIIENFIKTGPTKNVVINCSHLKVFSISHIKWSNVKYKVSSKTGLLFDILVNGNDNLTISCANCPDEDNSIICYDDKIDVTLGKEKSTYTLDYSNNNLGLDKEAFDNVKNHSNVANHIFYVSCINAFSKTGGKCSRVCCASTSFVDPSTNRRYCNNCPYPNVVYNVNGVPKLTKNLAYVSDLVTLIEKTDTKTCACCNRTISKYNSTSQYCALCQSVLSNQVSRAENVLLKYVDMLPLSKRMGVILDESVAAEDYEIALIKLVTKKQAFIYMMPKLELKPKGYLNPPKLIRKENR